MSQFDQDIQLLTKTSISRAVEAITNKEDATFFIGRGSCPFCRRFASTLNSVLSQTPSTVYFVNSEDLNELDAIQSFRQKYNIPTVPGFVHVHGDQVFVKCDSSMSPADIKAFMHI